MLDTLTPREREVLGLVAMGMSDREIATDLSIHHQSVGTHLYSIFAKLSVRNRTEAAIFVKRAEWEEENGYAESVQKRVADMLPELRSLRFYLNRMVDLLEELGAK